MPAHGPLAQLGRAVPFLGIGPAFESQTAHHLIDLLKMDNQTLEFYFYSFCIS